MTDLTTRLEEARQALHDLITGTAVVSLNRDGETVQYHRADATALRAYIGDLEAQAGIPGQGRRRPGMGVY